VLRALLSARLSNSPEYQASGPRRQRQRRFYRPAQILRDGHDDPTFRHEPLASGGIPQCHWSRDLIVIVLSSIQCTCVGIAVFSSSVLVVSTGDVCTDEVGALEEPLPRIIVL
jgi:hypothetical protein